MSNLKVGDRFTCKNLPGFGVGAILEIDPDEIIMEWLGPQSNLKNGSSIIYTRVEFESWHKIDLKKIYYPNDIWAKINE